MWKYLCVLLLSFTNQVNAQIITTIAGGGASYANGIPATSAKLINPHFLAFDKYGNLYYSDFSGCLVRKIDTFGIVSTIAGTGITGYGGDGEQSTNAVLKFPEGILCDTIGNVYIADHQNYRIRKIDIASGIITTIAGTGILGDSGDGGPATAARFFPSAIHLDRKGNIFISDNEFNKIRKINSVGTISTIAGNGIAGFSGDNGPATAAELFYPGDMSSDEFGNLYVIDANNRRVRKVDSSGTITTIAGTGIGSYNGDGAPAIKANMIPIGILYFNNKLYITEDSNQRIREIDFETDSNRIATIVGNGLPGYSGDNGTATNASINQPGGITVDNCGSLFFTDVINVRIRKIAYSHCNHLSMQNIENQLSKINIYPNPAYGEICVADAKGGETYTIVNPVGGTEQTGLLSEGTNQLPIVHLPPGLKILQVVAQDGERRVMKFIKE